MPKKQVEEKRRVEKSAQAATGKKKKKVSKCMPGGQLPAKHSYQMFEGDEDGD